MLYWFQWRLLRQGVLVKDAVHDPRLSKNEIRGWQPAPQLPFGATAVCRQLLLAISMASEDLGTCEPLTGIVPAAVSLACLLIGEGRPANQPASGNHASQPEETDPGYEGESAELLWVPADGGFASGSCCDSVEVMQVGIGSGTARELAGRYLRAAFMWVHIDGSPIDPTTVKDPSDVERSETLWQAVMLYRDIHSLPKIASMYP